MSNTFAHMKTDKAVRVKARRMTRAQMREIERIEATIPGVADICAIIPTLNEMS